MREKKRLIKKEEKDGVIRTLTKVEELKTYWIREYYDKKTGSYGSITLDEKGEIIDGGGGNVPDVVKSKLKNMNKKAE